MVNYAESVGKFQPRVGFETLGKKCAEGVLRNSEGVATVCASETRRNSFRVASSLNYLRAPRVARAQRFHPTRAARVGTPAWAGISERFQR